MPWQCSACAAEVTDDVTRECPSCGAAKTAWTVVQNQTRTLRIGGTARRFTCERAEDLVKRVAAAGAYADVAWAPTDWAPALPKAAVRDLAASGQAPAPADLVCVRQYPGAGAPSGVELTTLFEGRRAESASFEAGAAAPFDARFLLVFGPEPLPPEVQFPDVTILDVTDDTAEGHAPALEVRALKKPAVPLDVRRRPEVVRALLAGLFFETDKAFLLPKAVRGLRQLRRYYDAHPGLALLVVGHADTAGASEHNLVLSCERADAMAAFLRDDVERWTAYFAASQGVSKPWGTREVQWMLTALPSRELPFYEGEPTGVQDAQTSGAVERFQGWSNAKRGTALDVDGIAGPLTRRELVAAYMELDGTTFPAGATLLTHGCGEFHPEVPTGDGVASEENRRAEIFLFPAQVEPPPQAPCPAPGCPEYPEWRRKTVLTLDLTLEPGSLEVLLRDEAQGTPLADADVQVAGIEGRAARTGPDGRARFDDLFPGPYDVRGAMFGYVARRTLVDVPPGTGGGGGGGGGAQGGEHALVADDGAGEDAPSQAPPSREVDLPLEALAPALDLSRGLPEREVPVGDDPYADAPFEPATSFSILHRDHTRTMNLDDALPAPRDVLRVDASPSATKDWTLTVRVPLRDGSERKHVIDNAGRALKDGRFTSFLVCVYGGGGPGDPGPKDVAEHPHVRAIDVSDPQPDGTEDVARTLHLDAFGLTKTVALHVRRPRVVKLVGYAVPPEEPLYWKDTPLPAKESAPSARVVLHLGWRLRLEWTVLGPFDELVFTPSGRELTTGPKDDPGQATTGSATLDLGVDAPGPQGLCPVEARRVACPSHLAQVQAVGITRFAMRSLQDAHPLARYDVSSEKYTRVDVLPGRAGTWKTFPETIPGLLVLSAAEDRFDRGDRRERTKEELDRQLRLDRVWFGTAERSLYPWVSFEWTVVGPDDLQVELEVPRLAGEDPVSSHWDVGPTTFAAGGVGGREVKTKFIPAARTSAFLQADLSVWEKGVKRDQHRRLTAAVLRTRIDRPMPAILDGARGFELRDGGRVVSDGARVSAWSNLELRWGLSGDVVGNRLRLAVMRTFSASSDPIPVQDPLYELDIKEPGDLSSAATTLLGKLPLALAAGGKVTLVLELMRPANPDERERYKSPWVLSNGYQAARRFIAVDLVGSGRPGKFPCLISGDACPVNDALERKRNYDRALDELNELFARLRASLNAAQFVRAAIEEATSATKNPVEEPECAEALFKKGQRGVPSAILGETQLYADIREWEGKLEQAQKNAEHHAEVLIRFITSEARLFGNRTFQEHLAHDDHLGHSIDDDNVKEALALYGVTNYASVSHDEARRRVGNQTAHVLAVLTENLDATRAGQRFLRDFIVTAANEPGKFKKDFYAFETLFGYATKAYGLVSEPLGKLIFNSTSLLLSDLRRLSDDQINGILAARSLEAAQGDVLSKHFKKFLYATLGKGLHGVEQERKVATAVDKAIDEVFIRCNGKEAYLEAKQVVADVAEEQKALDRLRKLGGGEDLTKIDGVPLLWFSFFLDGVSMVLSLRKLEADMRKDETKASLSLLKDGLGLVGGAMGLHEVALLNRQSVLVAGEASSAELAGVAARIKGIGVAKNVCSGVAGVAGVILSVMEAKKAWKDRDLEKVLAHYAAGYAAACSVMGLFVPALGALGLWLGLAVWFYMEFMLDPPVVDWLEKTPWGVHPTMTVAEVISGFYGEFYDVSIRAVTGHDSNHDAIEVQSDLLSEACTIRVTIGEKAPFPALVTIRLAKDGGGSATPSGGFIDWHPANTTIDAKRRFRLLRAWELFPELKRDGKTEHEVKLELEVDSSNGRPELEDVAKGITFRPPPSPAIEHVNGHLWGFSGLRRRGGAHKGDLEFVAVDPGKETHVFTVSTRYADDHDLEVLLVDESWTGAQAPRKFTAKVRDETPGKTGEVKTRVEVKLWLPPEDDDIPFRVKVRLLTTGYHGSPTEVASGWTGVMRAARTRYLDA